MNRFELLRLPWRLIVIAALALVALVASLSCIFTVEPEEIAVILRFGKFVRKADPGIHLKLPSPVEQVFAVPVERQQKEEFGFRTEEAGVRSRYSRDSFETELVCRNHLVFSQINWQKVGWRHALRGSRNWR